MQPNPWKASIMGYGAWRLSLVSSVILAAVCIGGRRPAFAENSQAVPKAAQFFVSLQANGQKAWIVGLPEVKEGKWRFRQLFVNGDARTVTFDRPSRFVLVSSAPWGDFTDTPTVYASSLQAGVEVPGALFFDYAERCAVTGGCIEHIGIGRFELACRRNLIYYLEGTALGASGMENSGTNVCAFTQNLYWNISGQPVLFGTNTFAEWQASGQDTNGIVADPLFVDPAQGDFRLRAGSPASKVGFEPWDMSLVGPRPAPVKSK